MDISQPNSGPKINPINLALNTKNNFWECEAWARQRKSKQATEQERMVCVCVCAHQSTNIREAKAKTKHKKGKYTCQKQMEKKKRTGGVATKSFKDKSICENVKQEMIYVYVCGVIGAVTVCVQVCVRVWVIVIELWSSAYDSKSKPNIEYTQRQTMNDNSNSYDSMLNPDQNHAPVQIYLSVCCCWHELEVESSVCSNVCMCMSARVWAAVTAASLYDTLSIRFRSVLCCAVLCCEYVHTVLAVLFVVCIYCMVAHINGCTLHFHDVPHPNV